MRIFAVLFFLLANVAGAVDVGLAGVIGSKAILVIDGGSPRTLAVGEQHSGIKVISVRSDSVLLEIDGKQRSLKVGQNVTSTSSQEGATARLMADNAGHFFANGQINGRLVKFIVDTGASNISLSASEAKRLGLDLSMGTRIALSTANGTTAGLMIKLNSVKVGEITVHNIDAVVTEQDMPFVLLGMSFLNRTSMERNGDVMILKQRF